MRVSPAIWYGAGYLLGLVAAVPAFPSTDNKCVITTVYVTAVASAGTGGVSPSDAQRFEDSIVSAVDSLSKINGHTSVLSDHDVSIPHHGSGVVNKTDAADETHTMHNTEFLTEFISRVRTTSVETVTVFHGLSTLSAGPAAEPQKYVSGTGPSPLTNSIAPISSPSSQGAQDNPTATPTPAFNGGYDPSTEKVHSSGLLSTAVKSSVAFRYGDLAYASDETTKSRTLIVTVFETLTVVPFLSVPSSTSTRGGMRFIQTTITASHQELSIFEGQQSSTSLSARNTSTTGTSTSATLSTPYINKHVLGHPYGNWNMTKRPIKIFATVSVAIFSSTNVASGTGASLTTASFSQTPVVQKSPDTRTIYGLFNISVSAVFSGPFSIVNNPTTLIHSSIATDSVSAGPDISIKNTSPNTTYTYQQAARTAYLSTFNLESIGASSSPTISTISSTILSSILPTSSTSFSGAMAAGSGNGTLFYNSMILPSISTPLSSLVLETAPAVPQSTAFLSTQSVPLSSSAATSGIESSLPTNTSSTQVTLSVASTASTAPTACGEQGGFTLNFDDLPPLAVSNNFTSQPMPLFSPYHKFYFSGGFTVVPPPTDPYLPSSAPLLVQFLYDPEISTSATSTGEVSNDRTALLGCFNFNALGASLGCDSQGPDCDWQFTGLRYNFATGKEDVVVTQFLTTPSCPNLTNCNLVPVPLQGTFQNLTTLQINVTVAGAPKIWWMDDLRLGWYDDSCEAEQCRKKNI